MKHYRIIILTLLLSTCFSASAQRFLWDLDFHGFFDNREFTDKYQRPQTFFGTRLSPEIGIEIQEKHALKGGLSWIQEFGSSGDGEVDWRIYYQYTGSKVKAAFGSFSRNLLVQPYPSAMFRDSMRYFDPNINGALIQYAFQRGYVEAFIDWRRQQTTVDREIFSVGLSGMFEEKFFGGGWFFWMNHYAKPRGGDLPLVDNFLFNPYLYVNFDNVGFLSHLYLQAGALVSIDRNRREEGWHIPAGFLGKAILEWRFLGIEETLYAGGNQLPFYQDFGSDLHYSDPFYQAPLYSKTDVYAYFLRKKNIACKAAFSIHVAGGEVQTQQVLTVQYYINQDVLKNTSWKNFF